MVISCSKISKKNRKKQQSIIAAIRVVKRENPNTEALPLLEDALRKSMRFYVLDMASISSTIGIKEVQQEFKNGLELLKYDEKITIGR